MGEMWEMTAGSRALSLGKNFVPDEIALLFTNEELTVRHDPRTDEEADEVTTFEPDVFLYVSDVDRIRARLELQGFDPAWVFQQALNYLHTELDDSDPLVSHSRLAEAMHDDVEAILRAVITRAWRRHRLPLPQDSCGGDLDDLWEDLTECFDDPRFTVALLLWRARRNTTVRLDLSGCLMGGWLEPDERPHLTARQRLASRVGSGGSVIVVTEGSTDARLLSNVLRLAAPAVAHQFAFLDFESTAASGGTDQVVRTTRSLAAAGVVNRVVAVLDNDAAGRQAAAILRGSGLPSHFAVCVLPDVEVATTYPTIGPDGMSSANVNGRAAAIEMMFGSAALRAAGNGKLPPVRWAGPLGKPPVYQGAIDSKRAVQEHVDTELRRARAIGDLEQGIAQGCRDLARTLVQAARTIRPMLASEYSPLLAERVRAAPDQ